MKNMTMLVLVAGCLLLWGSYSYKETASVYGEPFSSAAQFAFAQKVDPNYASAAVVTAAAAPIAAVSPRQAEDKPIYDLQLVEGVSLYDDQEAVIESLGAPTAIQNDPYTKEFEIYQYPGLDVGFSLGVVEYVKVLPQAGSIDIDNHSIPMTLEAVTEELGKPDFVAEDGLVFKRNQAVIKLFVDTETQQLTSIDYFHRSSS